MTPASIIGWSSLPTELSGPGPTKEKNPKPVNYHVCLV